jgi:crotonobetainyl-CoA:carnitine CoA-transferase CaiB-like acyl-CoA transferase
MASALLIQNTRFMSIEAVDTERREQALDTINALRAQGAPYKEQLDVITGVRPVVGNIYYRCYRTSNGFIAVGCLSTPLRRKLLGAIGMEDWRVGKRPEDIDVTDPKVKEYGAQLIQQAEGIFTAKPTEHWLQVLDDAGVPAGPLKFTEELLDDPQVAENEFVASFDHPMLGPVRQMGPMLQMSETPLRVQGCSPTLGEHTDEVLRDLGYSDDAIAALREKGILGARLE